MPPRRRTFYLADATLLSNPKILRLRRQHPDDWITVVGAFHLLIGVATLNGSPKLSQDDISDVLGGRDDLIARLRDAGLMTPQGIDRATYNDWCPKPRPQYPSDRKPRNRSGGNAPDSGGVGPDSGGVGTESGGMPTSTTSSSSSSKAASSPRGVAHSANGTNDGPKAQTREEALLALSDEYKAGRLTDIEYSRKRKELRSA